MFFFISDMKLGMMDVGIFCKESRFGISTEKGTVPKRHAGTFYARVRKINMSTQAAYFQVLH